MRNDPVVRRKIDFLRRAVEHLDDKAKADLKVALYGSSFFLAVSLVPYGHLPYASLLISAIDLWYFMSWGSDQLRLTQHRDELKSLEGDDGLEKKSEKHPTYVYERLLYFMTPLIILSLFAAGLILDYQTIQHPLVRSVYFGAVALAAVAVAAVLSTGLTRKRQPH